MSAQHFGADDHTTYQGPNLYIHFLLAASEQEQYCRGVLFCKKINFHIHSISWRTGKLFITLPGHPMLRSGLTLSRSCQVVAVLVAIARRLVCVVLPRTARSHLCQPVKTYKSTLSGLLSPTAACLFSPGSCFASASSSSPSSPHRASARQCSGVRPRLSKGDMHGMQGSSAQKHLGGGLKNIDSLPT